MRIRIGYELIYECPNPTPMILMLNVHYSRVSDLEAPDCLLTDPAVEVEAYRDGFGNWCNRLVAPAGRLRIWADTVIRDKGLWDPQAYAAEQHAVEDLPDETLVFLLGSRYCETDRLSDTAWQLFGAAPTGWARVQAICDYVHDHITFGYEHARADPDALRRPMPSSAASAATSRIWRVALLPLHEHPGALLHRLPQRHRRAAALRPDGLRGLVRGLSRRPLAHVRPAQQRAPHRPDPDRPRPRRRRRRPSPTRSARTFCRASGSGPTRWWPRPHEGCATAR